MGRMGIGYPNRIDAATLSGGSWEASLPRDNLKTRYLSQVARSTDDALASTKFTADLGSDRVIRSVGLMSHNLSLAALVRVRARTAGDTMVELDGVTNLAGEYALRVGPSADYRLTMPSNWDPNDWAIACWFVPDFDSTDGVSHWICEVSDGTTSNRVLLYKSSGGGIIADARIGNAGVAAVTLTKTFTAGTPVFAAMRYDGTTLTLYVDTDGDGSLNTSADASIGTFPVGMTTLDVGGVSNQTTTLEGALNILITDDGSTAAAITDRFNAGAGMALAGDDKWLARHAENLVLHVGGNSAGTAVQVDTYATATDLLAGSAEGRYDFDGTNDDISFGDLAATFGGATKAWFLVEVEINAVDGRNFYALWGGTNDTNIFRLHQTGGGVNTIRFGIGDGAGGEFFARDNITGGGNRYLYLVRMDLTAGTDAGRLKLDRKLYDAATRQYASSWTSVSPTYGGTAPAALHTSGGAVTLYLGRDTSGSYLNGKIDDFRWTVGSTLTDAQRDAILVNEADPSLTQHWYPFDGNPNDAISRAATKIDGTVTGATQVADGRHHLGRMERYDKSGQYWFSGTNDYIDFGTYTGTNGLDGLAVWGVFTPGLSGADQYLFSHWDTSDNAKKSWAVHVDASDQLSFTVATDGAGGSAAYAHSTVLTIGAKYAFFVYMNSGEVSNADKIQIGLAAYDPATGTYAAFSTEQLGDGSVPATLQSPASTPLRAGTSANTAKDFTGLIDELRLSEAGGGSPSVATMESHNVYTAATANPPNGYTYAWDFDGDANSYIGSLDGTPTGAPLQWYDGRKPSGLGVTLPLEVDRATGSNQVSDGTYGLRIKIDALQEAVTKTSPSMTDGRWVVALANARQVSGGQRLEVDNTDGVVLATFPTQATLAAVGGATRKNGTGTSRLAVDGAASSGECYVDNWRAYELGVVTFSTQLPYIYDTGWVSAYPAAYPSGTYLWEEDVGGLALTSEQHALTGIDKYPHPWLHIIPEDTLYADARDHLSARYWEFEVDDTANADGYVEIGRAWASPLIKPGLNFRKGAGLGYATASRRNETDGGAFHMDARVRRPKFEGVIDMMDADEALVQWLELLRRAGITEQVLFVYDDADSEHLHRRSFLGYFEELSPLRIPHASWHEVPFQIVGDVA